MKRRNFFSNLLGVGAGLSVVKEIPPKDYKDAKIAELTKALEDAKKPIFTNITAYSSYIPCTSSPIIKKYITKM